MTRWACSRLPNYDIGYLVYAPCIHVLHMYIYVCSDRGECRCNSEESCGCTCQCDRAPRSDLPYFMSDCSCDPDICYNEEYPNVNKSRPHVRSCLYFLVCVNGSFIHSLSHLPCMYILTFGPTYKYIFLWV